VVRLLILLWILVLLLLLLLLLVKYFRMLEWMLESLPMVYRWLRIAVREGVGDELALSSLQLLSLDLQGGSRR
jgi:hypothetical protein